MSVEDPHPLVPTVVLYDIMSEAATRLHGTLIALGDAYHSQAVNARLWAEQYQQAGDDTAAAEALDIERGFNHLSTEMLIGCLTVNEHVDDVNPDDRARILAATADLRAEYTRRNADYEAAKTIANPAGGDRQWLAEPSDDCSFDDMSTFAERDRPNGGESSTYGRICDACTFDESVTSYDSIPDAQGYRAETGEFVVSFPGYLRGLDHCTNCHAVYDANGEMDRELTAVYRAGLEYIRLAFERDVNLSV